MKTFLVLLPLALSIGCASQPSSTVLAPTPPPPPGLRHAESLRAYHVGRTVDAKNILHERHTLYRVETAARWNLYGPEATGTVANASYPALCFLPQTNDWIRAEYHRQRETTQRLLLEANRLAQIYQPFQKTLVDMSEVAENQLRMRTRLSQVEHQLQTLTQELQRPPLSLSTNLGSRP